MGTAASVNSAQERLTGTGVSSGSAAADGTSPILKSRVADDKDAAQPLLTTLSKAILIYSSVDVTEMF